MGRFIFAAFLAVLSSSALAITPFDLPWKNNPAHDARYRTTDHVDGVFVLEFFANFCGACNSNAANVDELADSYHDQARVQVLDMGLDTEESEIQEWIDTHQPNHPVLQDASREVWDQIGADAIPTVVVMDCKGNIKYQVTSVWSQSIKSRIHQAVDGLLQQGCTQE